MLNRVPIRLRLTLGFATAMVLVLGLVGVILYEGVRSQVDQKLDLDVSRQTSALLSLIEHSPGGVAQAIASPTVRGHQNFVQVLDGHGRILAATPGLERVALLKGSRLKRALARSLRLDRAKRAPLPAGSHLVTAPVTTPQGRAVLIVGASLDQRAESLSSLGDTLAIVGPLALIIVTLAAYRLTAATLKPVEAMRQQAAVVSATEPGVRLPLPAANDEIRHLGDTLNEMLGRLEDSFARERTFVANASHELRTPLATLQTELDLALRRPRPREQLQDALRSAQGEVERLTALTSAMLALARADEQQIPIQRVEVGVRALLDGVRDRYDPGHTRTSVHAPDDLRILADPDRLEQALGNLLENALVHGGGEVTLRAMTEPQGGIALHVTDNGTGFAPAFIDHAFDRFSRGDPSRPGRGAGLGLSIVRAIAHAHDGEAYTANQPQGGADVWIVIPRSPDV